MPTCGIYDRRLALRWNSSRARRATRGRQDGVLDVSRRGKQNYEYASTNRAIGRKWAQGVAERYAAALARAEEVLEGVTAGRQPYPWDEENVAHAWRPAATIWEADVPETGESEPESGEALEGRMGEEMRAERLREVFSTYDGPVNRKGHPRLRPFREHAGMPDVTRAEIRQAALSHTQTPKETESEEDAQEARFEPKGSDTDFTLTSARWRREGDHLVPYGGPDLPGVSRVDVWVRPVGHKLAGTGLLRFESSADLSGQSVRLLDSLSVSLGERRPGLYVAGMTAPLVKELEG